MGLMLAPAPEQVDPRDAYTPLVGPNVCGYYAPDDTLPRPEVQLSDLTGWKQGGANVTKLELYVSLSARTLELFSAAHAPQSTGTHPLSATHNLLFRCDAASPNFSIHVYMHNERHGAAEKIAPPPAGPYAENGWLVYTQQMPRGMGSRIKVPLTLSGEQRIDISIVLEALDDDGAPLLEPSVLTTRVGVAPASGGWVICSRRQIAYMGARTVQLHEIYGFGGVGGEVGGADDESAADTSRAALMTDVGDTDDCPICISQPPSTLILPCTHALCLECAVHVRDSVEKRRMHEREHGRAPKVQYACPICRGPIKAMLALSAEPES
ncbi:hypothetical protein MCUN1_000214 [Malassezia cuniculi]|uniref:RING-type domain-containing protein n=1 Tax=Malassezia cuniculi TaxID=948313 RepID=A0AAF0ERM9_9BASI|nr:hypothetical protein MCUN1_000214 [Malassezia cuniculi]